MEEIRISVRNLIEFVERSGDIDRGFYSNARALQGIHAHQKMQALYSSSYQREVFLKEVFEIEGVKIIVEGRADGIGFEDGKYLVDEIKSTTRDLDELSYNSNILHWAQAKFYAYIYAKNKNLDEIDVRLTYFQLESEESKKIVHSFSFEELSDFANEVIYGYLEFSKRLIEWQKIRNKSLKEARFPFKKYRKGQREMAVAIYRNIMERNKIFLEAPTGIGKTMSAIFPSLKSLSEEGIDKVFYLVARSTGKISGETAIFKLMDRGLRIKSLSLTAKDKICINEKVSCNPKDCPYAKGHFDRVNNAIVDIFDSLDDFRKENIEKFARMHLVCPFEFELDLANFSDFIICDYNYAFDPNVYLKRFFDSSLESYVLLIDEAHNLPERARTMYSASLSLNNLLFLEDKIPQSLKKIKRALDKTIKEFQKLGSKKFYSYKPFNEFNEAAEKLIYSMNEFLIKYKEDENYEDILEIYFEIFHYNKIMEYYNGDFVSLKDENEIKLLCLDTREIFKNLLNRASSSSFFSATLSPLKYYGHLLGANKDSYFYRIKSPFDPGNFLVLRDKNISTTYKDRLNSIDTIVKRLLKFSEVKGNYIFFFPSYAFMESVYEIYKVFDQGTIIQKRDMTEKNREEFLDNFKFHENIRAFAVMGGVFSEGIDLVGKRLIGAAIITLGIPQISYERDILKSHFQNKIHMGYEFAYIYPAINKVSQSAGRVIRSEDDKGALLLIDKRFSLKNYSDLLPKSWIINDIEDNRQMDILFKKFWDES